MAWTTPTARTTGELITASIWNTDLKDNLIALRAGAIAITSQAALDFIYASGASQLARLVKGTGLQYVRLNAAAAAYEFANGPLTAYAATLANVGNTVAKTAFLSFTVPLMADGDIITIRCSVLVKNNKGSGGTTTIEVAYGAVTAASGANTWANDAAEHWDHFELEIIRSGADAYVSSLAPGDPGATNWTAANMTGWLTTLGAQSTVHMDATLSPMAALGKLTAPTFGSSQTVEVRVTFSAADATYYIHPVAALVHHRRATP